jgi:hypothetical protein
MMICTAVSYYYTPGKKKKKDKSYKILTMLIAAMYVNQSILISINWYFSWIAYVKYRGSNKAVAVFTQTEDTPLLVQKLIAVTGLLVAIKLGIADSIMVILSQLEL